VKGYMAYDLVHTLQWDSAQHRFELPMGRS
jgi:hypothetical protein